MVSDLIAAYRARIPNLTWMSPAHKRKSIGQAGRASVLASAIPDQWIDYSTLDVVRGDAFGNMRRAEAFNRSV